MPHPSTQVLEAREAGDQSHPQLRNELQVSLCRQLQKYKTVTHTHSIHTHAHTSRHTSYFIPVAIRGEDLCSPLEGGDGRFRVAALEVVKTADPFPSSIHSVHLFLFVC